MSAEVTPVILKAAMMFARRDVRPDCAAPWAYRFGGYNIVFATDGHTMFVARDLAGTGYTKKPVQICEHPFDKMPGWRQIVAKIPERRRATVPVSLNPKYHARIMRAASLLGVKQIEISLAGPTDELIYTLGPDAFAMVMPMRDAEKPAVPTWIRRVAGKP